MGIEQRRVTGMVLKSTPIGENDKRVVLLTKECGKLTAFVRGARRQNSPMQAATLPMAFGEFMIVEGRTSNTVTQADIRNYFRELHEDLESAYYAFYFLELADYYTREYNEETQMLKLLYQSLRALGHPRYDHRLVRTVYEWKTFVINGEYPDPKDLDLSEAACYALSYIAASPVEKLYTFSLSETVLEETERVVQKYLRIYTDHVFTSLEILNSIKGM